jgi:alanyl-tRNA synthetase
VFLTFAGCLVFLFLVQSRRSNYDTDVFMPLFAAIQSVIGCQPYQGRVGAADTQLVGANPTQLLPVHTD